MSTQTFWVAGQNLGSREIDDLRRVPGLPFIWQESHVYFCHHCGEIWGRLLHQGATYHQCSYRPCLEHGDGRLSAIWPDDPCWFARDWPLAAIQYEFLAQLAWAERT
jgi:hypothetical protein